MRRKFTASTALFGLGAFLATIATVGTYVQGGWASYLFGYIAMCLILYVLTWASTKPEE